MIYLDHAATSMHKPPQVYEAVLNAMRSCASVGRSGHRAALRAAETAFACRIAAGDLFEAEPEQVVFTFNATHGLNIAIRSLVRPGDRVVVSGFEHNAVMRPLYQMGAEIAVAGTRLFDQENTLREFRKMVTPNTKAVICTHVSNVFGYVLPVTEIAALCWQRKVPFVLDAAQSAGVLPISLKQLRAAFIAMPGHKGLLGPQGTGILLCGQRPKPLLCGGTGSNSLAAEMPDFLPDMLEVGTHNVPGIAGLYAGLMYLKEVGLSSVWSRENDLLLRMREELKFLDNMKVFTGKGVDQTGVLSFQILDRDCEEVAQKLAEADIAVRAGLHCAPLAHRSAGTLKQGTVRVSFSPENSPGDIDHLTQVLTQIVYEK